MSISGGAAVTGGNVRRNHRYLGADRFYYPPPLRKYRPEQEHVEEQRSTLSENRPGSSSACSVSSETTREVSNLCRFLEHTTPHVPAQYFPMEQRSKRRWKTMEGEWHAYYVLGDLWESFKEWSAYGAGVPLVLDGRECVKQYYNVSLSAIQLYVHPSQHFPWLSWNQPNLSDVSTHGLERSKPQTGSSSDEIESCSPPGQLIFEYFEHEIPYNREPLADKIFYLAHQFPELKTYRSCDLSPASWVSLAWYPIYRIPTGPTLESLSACFLTFHSLSTTLQSPKNDGLHVSSRGKELSSKLSLPILGLAFHKLKASLWDSDGVAQGQKANSLLRAADNWIRLLEVNHPDYNYFMSHYTYWR
ncbi:uncharacterized protein LOC109814982 isoform X1 [Cajanus cajan]|uniref:uncharacterized protein LOC109814982 isoform X1 n=1 Tax=Cajanus cajan TaxID=3821 RepID=UPI00098DC331|nr:uncharacterized protein LOC109814982 isoform X1 [Cajanus cajan]